MSHSNSSLPNRRAILKSSTATVLGLALTRLPAMAGPFTRDDFDRLVPADKKLSPEWVKSLFARGTPEVLSGADLKFVGMPVGGIGAGQLYLGGDGKLVHWDIFNQHTGTGAQHYAQPFAPTAPFEQSFALNVGGKARTLDRQGFPNVTFRGEYPIGTATYEDPGSPVSATLEAFSPFIPLDTDNSCLPATVLSYTLRNTSAAAVEVELAGRLENAVCLHDRNCDGTLRNRVVKENGLTLLVCSAETPAIEKKALREDIVFEDWTKKTYEGWEVTGTAFGSGPIKKSDIPQYQGDVGGPTPMVVNSHATAPGGSVGEKDAAAGRMLSREFTIERDFISFWIGGGKPRGDSGHGLHLVVDGKRVMSTAGKDNNKMDLARFDVRKLAGKRARLELVDAGAGPWANTSLGKVVFTDRASEIRKLEDLPDFGTMALGLLGKPADAASEDTTSPFSGKPVGWLTRKLTLAPGQSATVDFVLAWHFPNLAMQRPLENAGRFYAAKFPSAQAVVQHIAADFARLAGTTRLWRDTWYDSTLPRWFLDRTFLNTSILATSTCFRFRDGRFYGWEGVGCCQGTCGHVYHYAHATGRLFPELERIVRERVDFGLALQPDGAIRFRGEFNNIPAIDAQAGTILRALREHQMSPDDAFLKRNWPQIKLATQWLIAKDANGDGLIEDDQHNTLDTEWFGKVAWLSGLYLAALHAAAEMAEITGDPDFARQCRAIVAPGTGNLVKDLFDGEYFINKVDPKHLNAINSGTGCHIDQVFGQSWAYQVGLPRVLPKNETLAALKSLWRYNFTPDVGPYRKVYTSGRWYAMAGEAGLLMCTFPRKDWDFRQAAANGHAAFAGYFNECMNGFEYQVAGHMIWEGMVQEGLAVTRAVHDRYHASRRNPWNEVECGDHYARSMASYGVYLAACGFEHNGPKQHIGFAPRLTPEDFQCAFTSAEGWGAFAQKLENRKLEAEIMVRWGKLRLKTIALEAAEGNVVRVAFKKEPVPATLVRDGTRVIISLGQPVEIAAGEKLNILLA